MSQSDRKRAFWFCILSIFIAVSATDLYLPALPLLVQEFQSTSDAVQYTVASYLTVLALSALVFGPLADIYGRRKIYLLGFGIFAVGSFLCGWATSVEDLILARSFQGLGAGSISVLGLVLINDLYSREQVAKKMAQASLAIVFAPGLGQVVGGHVIEAFGWPYSFFLMGSLASSLFLFGVFYLPETKNSLVSSGSFQGILRNYAQVLTHGRAMALFMTMPLLFCGFWVFRTVTPFLFIEHKGVRVSHFGYYMLGIVVAHFLGSFYTQAQVSRQGPEHILYQGVLLSVFGAGTFMLLYFLEVDTPFNMVLCMLPYAAAMSMTISTSVSKGMSYFSDLGGTTSALFTFLRMGAGALGGMIGGFLNDDSSFQLTLCLVFCASGAFFLNYLSEAWGLGERKSQKK